MIAIAFVIALGLIWWGAVMILDHGDDEPPP